MNRRTVFVSLCLAALFLEARGVATAGSFSISPVADAFVANGPSGNLANNNYGGGGALAVAAPGLPNGEFQSVIKFDLGGARTSFDAQYGAGAWSLQSVSLQLSSSPHNNAIYNDTAAGLFNVTFMQNSSWLEGSGNASSPGASGITFTTLNSTFNSSSDQPLGTFTYDGKTSGVNSYSLQLAPALTSSIQAGGIASFRLSAADNAVSYLFTSRSGSIAPQLVLTAIPEPGILALFGLGGAVFMGRCLFSNPSAGRKV